MAGVRDVFDPSRSLDVRLPCPAVANLPSLVTKRERRALHPACTEADGRRLGLVSPRGIMVPNGARLWIVPKDLPAGDLRSERKG